MNQEKLNIIWEKYVDHMREMLHNMMTSNELTDVTLVSEDKKHFKAHKAILSACSPVFKGIISNIISSIPFIYLRGVQSLEIESILQFIYLGEATICKERMNEFLDVAKSLEIQEVSKYIETRENHDQQNELPVTDEGSEKIMESVIREQEVRKYIEQEISKYLVFRVS